MLLSQIKKAYNCHTIQEVDASIERLQNIAAKNGGHYSPIMERRLQSLRARRLKLVVKSYDENLEP